MERACPYCSETVPEGTVGRFCSPEHKWLYERRSQQQDPAHEQLAFTFSRPRPRLNGTYHGVTPRGRR